MAGGPAINMYSPVTLRRGNGIVPAHSRREAMITSGISFSSISRGTNNQQGVTPGDQMFACDIPVRPRAIATGMFCLCLPDLVRKHHFYAGIFY